METICKNFREFLEADKRYSNYLEMVNNGQVPYVYRFGGEGQNKADISNFSHFLYSYMIFDLNGLKEAKKWQSGTEVFRDIVDEVIENFGKEFSKGKLIGLEITEEDCYYIFDDNGDKKYISCCENLEQKW